MPYAVCRCHMPYAMCPYTSKYVYSCICSGNLYLALLWGSPKLAQTGITWPAESQSIINRIRISTTYICIRMYEYEWQCRAGHRHPSHIQSYTEGKSRVTSAISGNGNFKKDSSYKSWYILKNVEYPKVGLVFLALCFSLCAPCVYNGHWTRTLCQFACQLRPSSLTTPTTQGTTTITATATITRKLLLASVLSLLC